MLVIKTAQMRALEEHMALGFEARLSLAMRAWFPDQVDGMHGGEKKYQELLRTWIRRALDYGIRSERDIAAFVALILANAELSKGRQDLIDWCALIVESDDLAGASKIPAIMHRLRLEAQTDPRAKRLDEIFLGLRGAD